MRRKIQSPYTELQECNKVIAREDGKNMNYNNHREICCQSFQQLTPFSIPKYFESLHYKNLRKIELQNENNPTSMKLPTESGEFNHTQRMPKVELPKRKQFSMTKFQMAQLESNQISLGSFKRSNYTLNKILSTLPLEKLEEIYQNKQKNIQRLTSRKSIRQHKILTPKFNFGASSNLAELFGSSLRHKTNI